MMSMMTITMTIMMITFIVMSIANITSKKSMSDREKSSPFECGFDPSSSSRLPFSMHFFLITIIFLIFDVEITLILPTVVILNTSNMASWTLTIMIFILILLIGLYHEWNQGALNWTN